MNKKVHFLGIGGSGASAAAALANAHGLYVTGCDLEPNNEFTAIFKENQLLKDHSPDHLYCHPERSEGSLDSFLNKSGDFSQHTPLSEAIAQNDKMIDILAVTPAIFSLDPDNPELQEAKRQNIPILTWQQFVGEYLMQGKFVIAICGTHGKTTTTAMIAQILEDANLDPTVLLGAVYPKWKTNYKISDKRHPELVSGSHGIPKQVRNDKEHEYFVIEADEFNDNFLSYKPNITVVTNIEMDHPEYFKDLNAVLDSYEKFLLQTKDIMVANLQDKNVAEIVKDVMKQSKVSALDFNKLEIDLDLKIPGEFNILNAKAAFQVGLLLGIDAETIKQSLNNYSGVGRRFEYIGEYNEAKIYSDFGHHPTEIKVTMEAARQKFPDQKITLIYQPHMFSRTKALFDDFVKVFQNLPVDKIIMADIYPSREINTGLVTSQQLVDSINHLIPKLRHSVKMIPNNQILNEVKKEAKEGDILFFMSAGDSDKWAKELVAKSE